MTCLALATTSQWALADCPEGAVQLSDVKTGSSGCQKPGPRGPVKVGVWEWQDKSGHVLTRLTYDDSGVIEGPGGQFGADGHKVREFTFVAGQLEGVESSWWPDGHLREERSYHAGRLHGVRKRWVYAPPADRSDCTRADESCWDGTQECWISGERKSNDDCAALYAERAERERGRRLASIPEKPGVKGR
jgi:hypothetical protein